MKKLQWPTLFALVFLLSDCGGKYRTDGELVKTIDDSRIVPDTDLEYLRAYKLKRPPKAYRKKNERRGRKVRALAKSLVIEQKKEPIVDKKMEAFYEATAQKFNAYTTNINPYFLNLSFLYKGKSIDLIHLFPQMPIDN